METNKNLKNNAQEVNAAMNNETKNNIKENVTMKNSADKNHTMVAETMANEINKNEEGKVMEASFKETADTIMDNALAAAISSDIDEIIPAEERGVSEKNIRRTLCLLLLWKLLNR